MAFSEEHSFTVKDAGTLVKYSFDCDQDGKPKKIGDGSYGIVFKVFRQGDNSEHAAKLFYKPKNSDIKEIEEGRIKREIHARSQLLKEQRRRQAGTLEGIIKTFGGCEDFTTGGHPAYENLKSFFQDLKVSDFVAVSDWYNKGTLKDLLVKERNLFGVKIHKEHDRISNLDNISSQNISRNILFSSRFFSSREKFEEFIDREIEDESQRNHLKDSLYQLSGYDILAKLSFRSRIETILPFILKVARGIQILNSLEFHHLDLKTSNIFVKRLDGDLYFDVALGDLGFLSSQAFPIEPNRFKRPSEQTQIPLGTLHYRSPEQKDYYDICDVEIRDGGFVIVRDPKFKDSIIEKGDIIVFSKTNQLHKITEIDFHPTEQADNATKIKIEPNKEGELPELDVNTQAYFYKQPAIKTDLFGIGALAYDMITCGHSPERFYESLRLLDDRSEDNSVEKILDKYNQVASLRSTDNDAIDAFKYFRFAKNSTTYAPYEFVKIILKCMLYKTKGTYYTLEDPDPIKTLVEDLITIEEKYRISPLAKSNKLISPEELANSDLGPKKENKTLSEILENLSAIERKNYYQRLIQGIWCIDNLNRRIMADTIRRSDKDYLKFLSPEEIIYDTESHLHDFKLPVSAYSQKRELLEDIRYDYLHTKIDKNISKYFIPGYFYFLRRYIDLKPASINVGNKYKYKFLDISPYGNSIENEDFIVLKRNKNDEKDNIILEICDVDSESRTFSVKYPPLYDSGNIDIREIILSDYPGKEFVYYQNINPCKYYFLMLGKFFYRAFFIGLINEDNLQPSFSHILECTLSSLGKEKCEGIEFKLPSLKPYLDKINGNLAKNKHEKKAKEKLIDLICSLLEIYVLLSIPQLKNSFYNEFYNKRNTVTGFQSKLGNLKSKIAEFISSGSDNVSVTTEMIDLINPSFKNQDVNKELGLNNRAYLDRLGKVCEEVFKTIDVNEIYRESIVHIATETHKLPWGKTKSSSLFNL